MILNKEARADSGFRWVCETVVETFSLWMSGAHSVPTLFVLLGMYTEVLSEVISSTPKSALLPGQNARHCGALWAPTDFS